MRSEMQVVLLALIVLAICGVSFGAYTVYNDMQTKNAQLNASLNDMQKQLDEQNNTTTQNTVTKTTTKVVNSGSSSGSKVTYEEAGVNKNIGYMKTCKYSGCGYVYNSTLARCPRCGHRNICIEYKLFYFFYSFFSKIFFKIYFLFYKNIYYL